MSRRLDTWMAGPKVAVAAAAAAGKIRPLSLTYESFCTQLVERLAVRVAVRWGVAVSKFFVRSCLPFMPETFGASALRQNHYISGR